MIIGVPKEIKAQEGRVGMTPEGVAELAKGGHTVLVETTAGLGAAIEDEVFAKAGAEIAGSADDVWKRAELIVKVKEPLPAEYGRIRPDQTIFCYLHLAAGETLTRALIESGAVTLAFEGVETASGERPLLAPMSRVAGHLGTLKGAHHLQYTNGGRGVMIGAEGGENRARVLVLGAGIAGTASAVAAKGLGARVDVLDLDQSKLDRIAGVLGPDAGVHVSSEKVVREFLPKSDLVIGAVLVSGHRAPKVITRDMLSTMKKHSVIVDIAIDQGGCVETSRPTTHADPTFVVDDVIHYCVANMPGCVPVTSTYALAATTLPYVKALADHGWREASRKDPCLGRALATVGGRLISGPVADLFQIESISSQQALAG